MSGFCCIVRGAIYARRVGLVEGPRTLVDLARVIGMRPSTLHLRLTGRRPMTAETEAAIRAALPELNAANGGPTSEAPDGT